MRFEVMICGLMGLAFVGCAGDGAAGRSIEPSDVAVEDTAAGDEETVDAAAITDREISVTDIPDSPPVEPGSAPFPYTADQIRDAMPQGFWWTTRLEFIGKGVQNTRSVVTKATADEVWFETRALDAKGEPRGDARAENATWTGLRNHATFPSGETQVSELDIQVGERKLSCTMYLVTRERDGKPLRDRFIFAKSKPGVPVVYESYVNETLAFRMTTIDWGVRAD